MLDEPTNLDLSARTCGQFVEFFFERKTVGDAKQPEYFLSDLDGQRFDEAIPSSPITIVSYLTKLFSDFDRIVSKYSPVPLTRIAAKLDGVEAWMLSTRVATVDDVPLLNKLIHELAEYEREPQAVLITEEQLMQDGFGPEPKFRAILAEQDGQTAGYAVFFGTYSTWTGPSLFLEDLFVRNAFRGRGVGRALVCQVAHIAGQENCRTIRLDVLDWNESAITFYKSLGGEYLQQWRNVLIGAEAIDRLGGRFEVAP